MNDTIPVVEEATLLDQAYDMGYSELSGGDPVEDPVMALSHYQESAHYINTVAPRIRAMCGFSDTKGGTYRDRPDKVAVIPVGSEDDQPKNAELMDPQYVLDKAHESFRNGAYDGLEQADRGETDTVALVA
jgi:hypothetical protein